MSLADLLDKEAGGELCVCVSVAVQSLETPAQLTACYAGLSAHLVPPTDKMWPLTVLVACVEICMCVCGQ